MQKGNNAARILELALEDGNAFYMGDGLVVIDQREEGTERRHRAVVSYGDLSRMAANDGADCELEDGRAFYLGEGTWVIDQTDETMPEYAGYERVQRPVVTARDVEDMMALAA